MRKIVVTDLLINCVLPVLAGVLVYRGSLRFDYPSFISGYLADFLWAYAYASAVLIVWNREINNVWLCTAFFSSCLFEVGQYNGIIAGVGDGVDVIVYAAGFVVALLLNRRIRIVYKRNTGNPVRAC